MGPAFGLILTSIAGICFAITNNALIGDFVFLSGCFNLFNLFPLNPLDGGRMANYIAYSINKSSVKILKLASAIAFLLIYLCVNSNLFFIVAFCISLMEFIFHCKNSKTNDKLVELTKSEIIQTLCVYFAMTIIFTLIIINTPN